jgi:hypothetical protein
MRYEDLRPEDQSLVDWALARFTSITFLSLRVRRRLRSFGAVRRRTLTVTFSKTHAVATGNA